MSGLIGDSGPLSFGADAFLSENENAVFTQGIVGVKAGAPSGGSTSAAAAPKSDEDWRRALKHASIEYLSRRDHSRKELRQKLLKRFPDLDGLLVLEDVLHELSDCGYQSDERYCEAYLRMRWRKGLGPIRIRLELREKGVEEHLIDQWLEADEFDWFAAAHDAWRKKYRGDLPDSYKDRQKQQNFLRYRGFTCEQVQSVFRLGE